jgi:SAM-dependent methyltransferase
MIASASLLCGCAHETPSLDPHCGGIQYAAMGPRIKPDTIVRHAYGIYPPMAMLAGMQLDVFTPLKNGPMTAAELAAALALSVDKLRPLLYALVHADLLRLDGDRFGNTPESDTYLVRGRPDYIGSSHELYSDLWGAALAAGRSIRAGAPQVKHDFTSMSDEELAVFFRGLHAGALAVGRQLALDYGFERFRNLLDVGGGSGGVAIAACRSCPDLRATVVELPRVAPIAQSAVDAAKLSERVQVLAADAAQRLPEQQFDAAVLRNLLQVLGPEQARSTLRNVGRALQPGGAIFIVGHVVDDSRLAPAAAVGLNLVFLSIYDYGQAHTEEEHRTWLAGAGFSDIKVLYGAASGAASIITAHKTS